MSGGWQKRYVIEIIWFFFLFLFFFFFFSGIEIFSWLPRPVFLSFESDDWPAPLLIQISTAHAQSLSTAQHYTSQHPTWRMRPSRSWFRTVLTPGSRMTWGESQSVSDADTIAAAVCTHRHCDKSLTQFYYCFGFKQVVPAKLILNGYECLGRGVWSLWVVLCR